MNDQSTHDGGGGAPTTGPIRDALNTDASTPSQPASLAQPPGSHPGDPSGHRHSHHVPHPHGHEHDHAPRHAHQGEAGHPHGHGQVHAGGHGDHEHGEHGHSHEHEHDHGHGVFGRLKHAFVPHSHDANEAIQSAEEASSEGIRAAWIGLAGMAATAILQMFIVAISGSIALLADTLHNVGHAVTTIPLVLAFKIGQRIASKRYPYGYRRAEDVVGLFISAIIGVSAIIIIWESVDSLINPHPLANLWWVFAAGLIGAAGNELVAVYRIRTGKRIGSAALIAEGQHARADGLTSIAVVVGVLLVWFGFERADAIIGLVIALAIIGIMLSSLRTTMRRLLDGVEPDVIDQMSKIASATTGVTGVGRVRARWSGHRLEGDVEVSVDGDLSVLEGHHVAETLEHELLHGVAHVERIVVHINPSVKGTSHEQLHELTGHHVSREARERYLAKQRT